MTALEFARIVELMTDEQFDEFLAALSPVITEEDKKGMILHRGLYKLLSGPETKMKAMCTALGEQLYSEFNAMPREDEQEKRRSFTPEFFASVRMW